MNLTEYYMVKQAGVIGDVMGGVILPTAGQVAGFALGGPVGSAVGGAIGGGLGGLLTKQQSQSTMGAIGRGAAWGAVPFRAIGGAAKTLAVGGKALARGRSLSQTGSIAKNIMGKSLTSPYSVKSGLKDAAIGSAVVGGLGMVGKAMQSPQSGAPQY